MYYELPGQAAHWFEMPKVYRELRRVLKPNGCFAFWVSLSRRSLLATTADTL